MPIYEYQCEKCDHRLEKLQKISDDHLKDCPECGKPALKKLVSAAAFRLKGDGWYETDFKTGKKKNVVADGGSSSSGGSSSGDSSPGKSASKESKKSAGSSGSSNNSSSNSSAA